MAHKPVHFKKAENVIRPFLWSIWGRNAAGQRDRRERPRSRMTCESEIRFCAREGGASSVQVPDQSEIVRAVAQEDPSFARRNPQGSTSQSP